MGAAEAVGGSTHDGLKDTLRIGFQLIVPDPDDRPTLRSKKLIAPLIALRLEMLTAVQFNDQLRLPACEVGVVGPHGQLSRKFGTQAREKSPKPSLMACRMVAQRTCAACPIEFDPGAHLSNLIAKRASRTHP